MTDDFGVTVNDAEAKAFSLDSRGFSYRVLCRLLFGEGCKRLFRLPPAMIAQLGETDMMIVARGVTRGQGVNERSKLTRFQRLNLTHPMWRKASRRAALI